MLARYVGRVVYRYEDIECISRTQRRDNYNSLRYLLRCVYIQQTILYYRTQLLHLFLVR